MNSINKINPQLCERCWKIICISYKSCATKNKTKIYFYDARTRGGKIGHDSRTRHDMKLAGYGLRLNEFMPYSG